MARVGLNGHLDRMKGRSIGMNSDEEDGVQSGSATGFSDGEREENAHLRGSKQIKNAFDPVTQILDKIDAELVSLTRSQGSTSTATTATDCTVVHRSSSRNSPAPHTNGHITHNGYPDNRDELSISQLGSSNYKHPGSLQSSSSRFPGGSDRDTGIGTGSNSLQETSLINKEPEIRPLEPGDHFKEKSVVGHRRANTAPAPLMFLNGQHLSDDDKHQQQSTSATLQAKQVDDKFREILQKRKSGRVSDTDDAQTIRTEDFVDKFQDTMVYSSDEAEKIRSLEDDLHSDAPAPGYPPIYPKPTVTSSLPRPSVRSSLKLTTGHISDADSVRTEDFEHSFKDMMVPTGNQTESDLDTANTDGGNDPIHSKVKQLLKATAKSSRRIVTGFKRRRKDRISHNSSPSSNSILKTRSSSSEDKPKSDHKSKQHVRISPQLPQYQNQSKGEDSDDTLCSDKEDKVISPRSQDTTFLKSGDRDAETHREIVRESDRIRREMERERRSKTNSPDRELLRDRSPTRTYLTLTSQPKSLYDKGDRPNVHDSRGGGGGSGGLSSGGGGGGGGKSLSDEEKEKNAELRATQSALDVTQAALLEARKDLKNIQAQYEDARTQLMLSEYKRENSTKELARISNELCLKQEESKRLETMATRRREEMKHFDDIGFTKEEAVQIISENEKMKSRLRNLDAVHAERDEVIQQLETSKQELFNEQKKARGRIEELQEELENMASNLEQTQTEKEDLAKRLQKMEVSFKLMEREKNELIQEKTRQYEEERDKYRKDKSDWRKRSTDDVELVRQELVKMTNRVAALQEEVQNKDEINHQLRDEMLEIRRQAEQEKDSKSYILEEHKKTLQTLRKETDCAMVQLRESLFLEKQKTMDAMREELEQERRDITARTSERYEARIAELETIMKAKNEELGHLNGLADKLEADIARNKTKNSEEIKLQVQEAVAKERQSQEEERAWAVQQEREGLEREHRAQIAKFHEDIGRMKEEQKQLEIRMKEQRAELDDMRNSNKTALHEKLIAVARAKELMRQEHVTELERIKEQMKNEHKKEIDKLRDTIRIQEDELRQLREERVRVSRQQKDSASSLDRTERTLINEINEECRKTSEVLGLNPRKVNLSSSTGSTVKSPTTSALPNKGGELFLFTQAQEVCRASEANLRACNEELRLHVTDLQRELELQRNTNSIADREKDEALSTLKRQLEREKEEEMMRLKERLVRGLATSEHRSPVYTPDNDIAARQQFKSYPNERQLRLVSDQQQLDLERLEREISKLAMNQGASGDLDYAKRLSQLHSKVKQLQSDNTTLRRAKLNSSSSNPDLMAMDDLPNHRAYKVRSPSPTRDMQRLASNLELRAKEHDYETEALTEHQRRNRDIMSRKMAEMSKLQNTLTNQAKELIQLEKAYTQLNQSATSPRPRSALR
ncbi:myosin heavy chain, cardiac muscle isoform-like isoform X2 [Dreissena polymorpha]|uniref:myosin heavy chain, cardiac muscle isoform-like isoform X2 n=1 Tax=Dreissena polymorpha TaxID=45954 RepID=UPI002264B4AD|nr:myosin heavy chain, cardiac muscle isoform-like isoform X2 [Dreissena polymorpha]